MRFSMIRTGIVAVAASLALAACGGHGLVPSQSAGGDAFAPSAAMAPAAASPCQIPKLWYFMGGCKAGFLTSAGGKFALPKYKGITWTTTLGKNSAKGKVPFVMGDATGAGDITSGPGKFPIYGVKTCLAPSKCPGSALVYFEAVNDSKAAITFNSPSQLVVAAAKFPGKSCFPAILRKSGASFKWQPFSILTGSPKGGKLTLNIPVNPAFMLPKGPLYVALVCQ